MPICGAAPASAANLQNIDVSKDAGIDHINIDKSGRLHNLVVNKVLGVIGRGGAAPRTAGSGGNASINSAGADAAATAPAATAPKIQ